MRQPCNTTGHSLSYALLTLLGQCLILVGALQACRQLTEQLLCRQSRPRSAIPLFQRLRPLGKHQGLPGASLEDLRSGDPPALLRRLKRQRWRRKGSRPLACP